MNDNIDLISKVQRDCIVLPVRFAPYFDSDPNYGISDYKKRKPITATHSFRRDEILTCVDNGNLESLRLKLIDLANQLCAKALFSDVEFEDGSTITAFADGVTTINSTGGFCRRTFDEIVQRFAESNIDHYETPIAVGISGDEHRALNHYSETRPQPLDIVINNGRIEFVNGHPILLFGQNAANPCLETNQGVRSCFAITKRSLAYSAEWFEDKENETFNLKLSALRLNGKQVCRIKTTVGA